MKLIMMKGLPGSGKSTKARELVVAQNGGRINRDDLRAMLFDSKWSGKRESIVVDCEKAIAAVLAKHDVNSIVDDTNLSKKHRDLWSEYAKNCKWKFEEVALVTDLGACILRDAERPKPVGRPIIERMALQHGLIDWGEKPLALVDIDGTLADGAHREHFVAAGSKKDWKSYFELCGDDGYHTHIFERAQALAKDHTVCVVSGRPDTYWSLTRAWLARGPRLDFAHIFMRSGGDGRPDTEVKADFLKHMPKERIAIVLDDRPVVCRMWEAAGLKVDWVRGRELKEF